VAKLTEQENIIRNRGFSLLEMTKTKGWETLEKHLKDISTHSWVDPREAKDKDDFLYREIVGWAGAKAATDLVNWVQGQISQAEALEDKAQGRNIDKFEAYSE